MSARKKEKKKIIKRKRLFAVNSKDPDPTEGCCDFGPLRF